MTASKSMRRSSTDTVETTNDTHHLNAASFETPRAQVPREPPVGKSPQLSFQAHPTSYRYHYDACRSSRCDVAFPLQPSFIHAPYFPHGW